MYSLFQLLFRNSYWRMLLRRATWSEARLSLKRAHKDKRARKHVLAVGLLALLPLVCVAYAAWLVGSGMWLLVPIVLPLLWWQNRRSREDDEPKRITPGPEPRLRMLTSTERVALRAYFGELALVYAVLVDRVASENFLKKKELPEGFEVASRRMHLDLLKSRGLWEKMTREDREALMMADGHWEWPMIRHVSLGMEPLRLLRWILQIDFFLPVVGQQLTGDFGMAHELVMAPEKAMVGKALVDAESLEVGRDAAQAFFQRCLAEGIARGYFEPGDAESERWAKDVSAEMGGRQSEDFVLGDRLVSEVDRDDLMWATSVAHRRAEFLSWAVAVIESGAVPEGEFVLVS